MLDVFIVAGKVYLYTTFASGVVLGALVLRDHIRGR